MKIKLSQKVKQMASALLIVMVLGGILCLFVIYYLSLVEQQNRLSVRSQAWNIAIAVAEAGIEEGLEAINSSDTLQASDGWLANGAVYTRTNTLPGDNSYWVSVDRTTATAPVITARSYVTLPALAAGPSLTMFAIIGSVSIPSGTVSRAVRVTCSKNPSSLFSAAMVSKHAIDLKGNGVLTDSFDSSNPAKSTNGKYDPSKYAGDFGQVATNDGLIVGVGNANIYGKLHTGPNGGYDLGPQGGVGTHEWQAANGGGMQPGYFAQDANFTFPKTELPDTSSGYTTPQPLNVTFPTNSVIPSFHTLDDSLWWLIPKPPPPGLVTNLDNKGRITSFTWTTYVTNTVYVTNRVYDNALYANGKYVTDALVGSTIVLGPNVTLVLPNGLTGGEKLFFDYTDNTSPGLTVYAGGRSASISGNQYVNPSGFAGSLLIYCAPTVTSFTLNGNGQFTGVLVAPNADLAMNGSGNSTMDFCGSLMVNNVRLNGHFGFHWDEALDKLKSDNDARYLVQTWNEIR
jgi:Tfp pilus assembly protein PilX